MENTISKDSAVSQFNPTLCQGVIECVNTLKKVVSGCNLGAPDFGGRVDDDSDSGYLERWVNAAGSQI
ncbi:hypothetical protein ABVK25_006543 [Lepraria finkii]|uniref:Uncharacterized protein n=1 Tax=Lepraria finkii TaxID=1340010 RepID=A0ABR4B5S5_9LECA